MNYIAFDIETVPIEITSLTNQQRTRLDKDLSAHITRKQISKEDDAALIGARDLVMATNWLLGRICCISVQRIKYAGDGFVWGKAKSFVAEYENEEADMLAEFWEDVARFSGRTAWVSFNGKRFDVPFLFNRTIHHHIEIPATDAIKLLRETKPWQKGHLDLMELDGNKWFSLADLCDFLHVESPKESCDGSQVAQFILDGRIKDVAKYCEADVNATLQCFIKTQNVLML